MVKSTNVIRSCTDIFCCILFLVFWIGFFYISVFAFKKGNIENLAETFDADNKACGRGDRKDYPYLFMNDVNIKLDRSKTICVKKCPSKDQEVLECKDNLKIKCEDLETYRTIEVAKRFCLPFDPSKADFIKIKLDYSQIQDYYADLKKAWIVILGSIFLAFIIGLIFCCLLEYLAVYVTYLLVLATLILIVILGFISYKRSNELKLKEEKTTPQEALLIEIANYSPWVPKTAKHYKWIAISLWVFAGLLLLILIFFNSSLVVAANVIKLTADFITDVKSVIIVPIVIIIFYLLFIAFWTISFGYLYSIGELKPSENYIFGVIERDNFTNYSIYYYVFALFWGLAFLHQINAFIVIYSAIEWSYTDNNSKMSTPIFSAFFKGLWFHLGTLAFGSLLLALVWILQVIVAVIEYLCDSKNQNQIQKILLKCCAYYLSCFERFIKFINKQAYCDTVMQSTSFCTAAKNSFSIMINFLSQFTILSFLVEFFNIIASIFISSITTIICFYILDILEEGEQTYVDFMAPLVVIWVISFLVSCLFTSIYDNASIAIMYCAIKGDMMNINMKYEVDMLFDLKTKKYEPLERNLD